MLSFKAERTTSLSTRLTGIVLVAALSVMVADAQIPTAARPDRGVSAINSYSLSDIERINLSTGNVNLAIPLASMPPIPGGKLSAGFKAVYNSRLWDVTLYDTTFMNPIPAYTDHTLGASDVSGWIIGAGYRLTDVSRLFDYDNTNSLDPNDQQQMYNAGFQHKMVLTGPDGSKHELRPLSLTSGTLPWAFGYYAATPASLNTTLAYYSFDGSYLWATIDPYSFGGQPTSWRVYMPDGSTISFNNGVEKIKDTNGNRIDIYDEVNGSVTTTHIQLFPYQAGRELRYVFTAGQPGHGQVQYYTVNGIQENIEINFAQVSVHGHVYANGLMCPDPGQKELNTQLTVIRSVALPQSQPGVNLQYSFAYNCETNDTASVPFTPPACAGPSPPLTNPSHGWGSLSHMTLPTGATVDYTYHLDGIYTLNDVNDASREGVSRKGVTHDGVQDTWTYTKSTTNATMQGPDGSSTTEDVYLHDDAYAGFFGGSQGRSGLTYRTTRSGSSGAITVVERHWSSLIFDNAYLGVPGGGQVAQFNPIVDAEYTTLMDSSGNPSKMSAKTFQYDFNGSVNSESDYDWFSPSSVGRDAQGVPMGVPAGLIPVRVITNSYYNPAPASNSPNVYSQRNLSTAVPLILNAPLESSVWDGAGNQLSRTQLLYDNNSTSTPPTAGNLTSEKHRLIQENRWITTSHQYDGYGNSTQTAYPPPLNNVINIAYGDSTHAHPTSVTVDPLNGTGSQTTYTAYDYYTGAVISITDPNNKVTNTSYTNQLLGAVDPFVRPGVVTDPQNRTIVSRYYDSTQQVEVWSDLNAPNDALLRSRSTHDQLGRAIKKESSEDGSTYTLSADTAYEQMGLVVYTSNPHRTSGSSTDGWTRTTKDVIGRVVEVATFDGATKPSATATNWNGRVQTSYNAEETTLTDQAGEVRRSLLDGVGRLIRADEPDSNNNLGSVTSPVQPTSYFYDALGNLTVVQQGGQQRIFTYDSLSRLTSAKNPEQVNTSGQMVATTYAYYDNGNLQTKTDARSVVTTYVYDGLNRATSRTYSGPAPGGTTPGVNYVYDTLGAGLNGKGRLTSVSSSVSSYSYGSYDAMGRVLTGTQTTDANSYPVSYQYNLAGGMTSETYPSGRVVATEYDSADRIAGVRNQGVSWYYAGATPSDSTNRIQYTAHGAISAMKLGSGRWEHTSFNPRLQPTQIGLGTSSADSSVLKLDYTFNTPGQSNNNGNVLTQVITIGSTAMTQTYGYDSLNRLSSATESGAANWSQSYGYDRFGNRWYSGGTYLPNSALTPQSQAAFNQSTNRLVASQYDYAGNQATDAASSSFTYDAENRQITSNVGGTSVTYSYDGDGHRVKKVTGSTTTIFVYNAGGQLIAEYTTPDVISNNGLSYLTSDHLDSTRVVTDINGFEKSRRDYLPFGEEIGTDHCPAGFSYGAADGVHQKFTQYERDTESQLDFAKGRYFSSAQGRFASFDRLYESAKTFNPQSWNRYSYCLNNPLVYVDPSGLLWWKKNGTDQPVWFEGLPYEDGYYSSQGWTVIQDLVYDAGDEGWVVLDPSSNNFAQFDTEADANDAYNRLTDSGASYNVLDSALEMSMFVSAVGAVKGIATLSAREALEATADLAARRALQLSLNKIAGREAELLVKEQLEAEGYRIIGSRVGARTSDGMLRVIDHLVKTPAGELQAIEVKAGGGVRDAYQLSQDGKMATQGAKLVGKNAGELRGQTLPTIETVVRRVP